MMSDLWNLIRYTKPAPPDSRGRLRQLGLEPLESRHLLSVAAWEPEPVSSADLELATSLAITETDWNALQSQDELAAAPELMESAPAVPALSSNPSAAAKLYLDFDGHFEASWGAYSNITTPVFSLDSDLTTFSSTEITAINTIWQRVAEDFAPFDIDVTTVEPGSFADREGIRVAIGGNNSWYGSGGGVAYVNTWTNFVANTVYVFPQNLANNSKYIAEASSHESGHGFGLYHQSRYDAGGTKTEEYHTGDGDWAPVMGLGYYKTRTTWHNGTSTSATTYQDDMAILSSANNAFGYRTDDHGDDSSPTELVFSVDTATVSGIIETMEDEDAFSFTSTGGSYTFTQDVAATGANLDSTLELRTTGGSLIASAAPTDSYGAAITVSLAAGDYVLITGSAGQYGSVGQYTVTATMDSGEVNHAPVADDATFSLAENAASGTVVGTVTATDEDDPAQTLSYAITAGDSAGVFAINGSTGQITVADNSTLDHETISQYMLTVQVTDDGTPSLSDTATITVDVADVNDAPVLGDATFSIAENSTNGTAVGNVSATDEDSPAQTLSYAITAGNDSGVFAIDGANGQITVLDNSSLDRIATPQYTLTIQVTDNGSPAESDTAAVTVNITAVNHAPVLGDTTYSLAEDAATGAGVGTVTASDEDDPAQTLAYAITAGNSSGVFAVNSSTGQITVADGSLLDYESVSQYVLTVEVTDDGTPVLSDCATVTVNITEVNDAPQASDASCSLAENAATGAAVGTVAVSDEDSPAQTISYAITAGNSGGVFVINSASGQITVADNEALDYEGTSQYVLTVQVTDNGTPALSSTATITVDITNVNEAPVLGNAGFLIAENTANGSAVGTVTATDEDSPAQSLTYAIAAGNDSGAFAINSTTGQITVANGSLLDYESASQYALTVQVSDDGSPSLSDTATITVNITDVNDAPILGDDTFSLAENAADSTAVGTVTATDEDSPVQTLAYAITGGNDDGVLAINSTTGEITVADGSLLDHESANQYTLTVQVSDTGSPNLSGSATVTVNITDVNEAPVLADTTFSLAENAADGTLVGTVTASDEDAPAQTLTYAITSGDGSGVFAINSSTGQITVAAGSLLDYESTSQYTLTVQVGDNGSPSLGDTATVTVNVTDVNEAPQIEDQTFSVREDVPNGTVVGAVAASDEDSPEQTLTYAITAGNAGGPFGIDSTTGEILITKAIKLDATTTPQYLLTVEVTDNGSPSLSGTALVTVNVTDGNTDPQADDATFSLAENAANSAAVGTVTATDADTPAQTLTYTITAGNGSGVFAINGSTGEITVADNSSLDHETTAQYSLTVQVTDNGSPNLSDTAAITVNITDVNEAPVLGDDTFSLAENAANSAAVGTVTATDEDSPTQTLTYTITAGNGSGVFAINGSSGQITVADNSSLDHETTDQYTLTVQVTDNGSPNLSDTAAITVNITDVNEAPVLGNETFSLAENAANDAAVGLVTGTDEDSPAQTLVYTITAGNGDGVFKVNPFSGQITVDDNSSLDYETTSQYTLTVQARDNGFPNMASTATITVNITDVNEAPVLGSATFALADNATNGATIGTITATDEDTPAQTLTYTITAGNASGVFAINGSSGQITVADSSSLDYDATPQYVLTVRVIDNGSPNLLDTATITINIDPVDSTSKIGVFEDGRWYLDVNGSRGWDATDAAAIKKFGWTGATPIVGDWNNDGIDDIGVFANGKWYLDVNGSGGWDAPDAAAIRSFGWSGATPVVGDWNNDGIDDIGVFANGKWYRDINGSGGWDSADAAAIASYGWTGAIPVVGDWNSDGVDDIGVFASGRWYRDINGSGGWDAPDAAVASFGWSGATPVVGDWNSDGIDDIGVYANGRWYRDINASGDWDAPDVAAISSHGWAGVTPVVGNWSSPASLVAKAGPAPIAQSEAPPTAAAIAPLVETAIGSWLATPLSADQRATLDRVDVQIADLRGAQLGQALGTTITLDINAAGYGWFVDSTPHDSEEFHSDSGSGDLLASDELSAEARMDMLTVIMHELGHILGLEHHDDGIMRTQLSAGTRWLSSHADSELLSDSDALAGDDDFRPATVDAAFAIHEER